MSHLSTTLTLSFIRHGESELSHLLRGWTDDALTTKGWQQMQHTFETHYNHNDWQVIISSPLQRCKLFAEHKSQKYKLPLYIIDDLKEIYFGDWEAISTAQLYQQSPQLLADFWQTPTQFTPPNAESLEQFAQRIQHALSSIYQLAQTHHYRHICIITHGGVIKYLHCIAQNQSLDYILTMPTELGELHQFYYQPEHQQQWIRYVDLP